MVVVAGTGRGMGLVGSQGKVWFGWPRSGLRGAGAMGEVLRWRGDRGWPGTRPGARGQGGRQRGVEGAGERLRSEVGVARVHQGVAGAGPPVHGHAPGVPGY